MTSSTAQTERAKRPPRERNPEATTRDILVAAREEFVEHGLNGARVDRIAERAGANKRLLYHYVGNKEALYSRVLLEAYRDIRAGEAELHLGDLAPDVAMAELVGFTFDHFLEHPWFIRLLSIENIHRARYVREITELRELHSPIIGQIAEVLARGETSGSFRRGVDPVQLYISVAGLSYFFFSNIHTLSVVFDTPLATPEKLAERRAHAIGIVLSYLRRDSSLPQNN